MILNLPYSALRAFEAVVRHSGFSPAADELGISQSAVSQHVRALEEWTGRELLVRGARQSAPTRDGEQLARAIAEGLGGISDVCNRLRERTRSDRTIVISCLPGFAFNWLFPRLLHFDLAHPDLSISIATDTGQQPFSGASADVGIRYGVGDFSGLQVDLLMTERLFPVCAPDLSPRPESIEDLAQHTLLVDENLHHGKFSPTWEFWARQCGVALPDTVRTRQLGQSNMVVQAAIEGLGVALGREPLVIDALSAGRLIRPLPHMTDSPLSYWLVRRPDAKPGRKVEEFLNWIKSETAALPDLPAAMG
ncbi:LysR substrate-binding domain-containing protein [Ovoidimarina sediminis]|uniref:LysR substrate-binding domain-containing protein n=1 Tax=Ovoidimarina sediminis TaxID=3079856 RepID=UPI00290BFBE5|nr:LysR substrate-binding domain-containing protein [Rhodophyticola sp. MJ-SS7]MDU8944105.1 LysR substrate-binding domain-containing protein [Rhodophyticola sp. MJ-SS7]